MGSPILLYSVAIAAFLIYVPYAITAYGRFVVAKSLSDPMVMFAKPRTFTDKLPGYAQRASWAHQNAFESFALYAPAALMAYVTGQSSTVVFWTATAYLTARLLFSVFYILDMPPLRSLMFGVGSLSIGILFWLSCQSVWLSS
ncbi:MAG: MAPEG family protein [Leptolyngbya sp. SIO4C1]|nr:MAPEG family protein [Leptolyngbya sp. SIO4C1]